MSKIIKPASNIESNTPEISDLVWSRNRTIKPNLQFDSEQQTHTPWQPKPAAETPITKYFKFPN